MIYGLFFSHTPALVNIKTPRPSLTGNINFILCVVWFEDEGDDAWSGEDEDDCTLEAVECRWKYASGKNCGAILQSKAYGLRHVQVVHVGEVVVGSFGFFRRAIGDG